MLSYTQKTLNINLQDKTIIDKTKQAILEIKEDLKKTGDYDALSIAYKDNDLQEIIDFSKFLNNNFKKVLVLGIGGSSLGAKTLLALKHQDKVEILENIDSDSVKFIFDNLDFDMSVAKSLHKFAVYDKETDDFYDENVRDFNNILID